MAQKRATMSDEATTLYQSLRDDGFEVPLAETIEDYRVRSHSAFETQIAAAMSAFEGDIETLEIAGIPCRQLTPADWSEEQGLVIQYAYGGGYVCGSTYEDLIITCALAHHSKARIVMVEYRLSPEFPYPLPQQDMHQVYPSLEQRYGAGRLVVSGESAGGNQALGLMHHIRDHGLTMPRCAVLFSPWSDLANQGDSHIFNDRRDPTLNNAWVESATALHIADADAEDPGVSPIYGDMHSLPPCIITTGSRDLLMSQCLRLAQRLRSAGVECDLRVWEGLWHVFEFYPIPEAQQSIIEVAKFIKAH